MKGIILAGGSGTRLYPLTKVVNKHLLPIGKYPMIYYSLYKLRECGIKEVMIVSGKEDLGGLVGLLGSGQEFGLELSYRVQEEPGGIAQALSLAESFAAQQPILAILGDNIFEAQLRNYILDFQQQPNGAMVFLKQVADPGRYGIAEVDQNRVVGIEEKPLQPKSNYCVTGIYLYDQQVFALIRSLKPSARNELEITDLNKLYLKLGLLNFAILDGWWIDAGTFSAIYQANQLTQQFEIDFNKL